jgi:regulator of protease activity HflC (stomatin/prohibitin superfamily)
MEKKIFSMPGIIALVFQFCLFGFVAYHLWSQWNEIDTIGEWLVPISITVVALIMFGGYVVLPPNYALIVSFFGKYQGTFRKNGFFFLNPFYRIDDWSLALNNFTTKTLLVNDKNGLPMEIAAVISHKIDNVYRANYDVGNHAEYIDNQCEISLRTFAKLHTYEQLSNGSQSFTDDLNSKLELAGTIATDAAITHLALSGGMAEVMLQKQQAQAISEAKEIIVENAVEMAKAAAVHFTDMSTGDKAKFASNLVLVLCSDRGITPVVEM